MESTQRGVNLGQCEAEAAFNGSCAEDQTAQSRRPVWVLNRNEPQHTRIAQLTSSGCVLLTTTGAVPQQGRPEMQRWGRVHALRAGDPGFNSQDHKN